MNWLKEHKKSSILILTVLILIIIFIVSAVRGGESSKIGQLLNFGAEKIQQPLAKTGDTARDSINGIFKFRSIVKENKELKEEISILKNDLIKEKMKKKELQELRNLSKALNYESVAGKYKPVSANVVAINGYSWMNIFTIDRGKKDGLKVNDIVLAGEALVGRISDVSADSAKVISISDEANNVSFKVVRNMDYLGVVQGDGKGGLTGFTLDDKAHIIEGDELITSGMGIYPDGITIGKVESVKMDRNTLLKTITIAPAISFKGISKVTVLI